MNDSLTCLVLVVDDDHDLRETMVEFLTTEGFRVIEAVDGEQGLARAREHQPQVILLDHRMPGLTGAEVCQALRDEACTARIILTTAARNGSELARSLAVDHFLAKPFDLDDCIHAVTTACCA